MENSLTAGVLDRLLEPISRVLNPASARALAELEADSTAQARIAELAGKCNEGLLSTTEQKEYETYVHAANLIAILQPKARLYLKGHAVS
jgi:hypothetical protein